MIASVGVGMLLYNYALPISTALLNAHLIEEEGWLVRAGESAAVADHPAFRGH